MWHKTKKEDTQTQKMKLACKVFPLQATVNVRFWAGAVVAVHSIIIIIFLDIAFLPLV